MATEDSLHRLRADGDPVARELLDEALKQPGRSAEEVLAGLREPAADSPQWLQSLLGEWVRQGPDLPPWANRERIACGQEFFHDWDLAIGTALFTASLPSAYAGALGAPVLARVSQLASEKTVAQRIGETGQMLLDITEPGALERGGAGYRRLVRVRMLHAAVRARLLGPDPPGGPWPQANGVPANQEDLLATLMTFTTIVFRALDRMGIELPVRGQESYLHLWAVTGNLLGIAEAEQMCDLQYAQRLTDEFQQALLAPSRDGVFLMNVLLDEMEFAMPLGGLRVPRTLVRFLIGDQVANMVEVPAAAWWSPALPAAAAVNRRLNRYSWGRRISTFPTQLMGRRMIQLWIDQHRRDERHPFRVTAEQCRRWRVTDDGTGVAAIRRRLRGRRQRHRMAHPRVPRQGVPEQGDGRGVASRA
jgi:hypothetical protein